MERMNKAVILYDGICNLCNGTVRFLIKHDKREKLLFASLQSKTGQKLLRQKQFPTENNDSFIIIVNGQALMKSDAALAVSKELGGCFTLFLVLRVIPKFIRDYMYSIVAKNRYKWFGKKNHCMVPTPELKERFLE